MVGDLAGSDREVPHDQRLLVAGVELENDPGLRQAEVVRHADAVQDLGDGMDLECIVGLLERHARRVVFEDVDPVRVLGQGPAIRRPGLDLIDQGLGQIEFGGVACRRRTSKESTRDGAVLSFFERTDGSVTTSDASAGGESNVI